MTAATATTRIALNDESRFFTATAIAGLLGTLIGFAPTYFLMRWFDAPPLPFIVHVHGIFYTGWILLYLAQTSLVAVGRRDLHKKLGVAGIVLGAAMVILGVAVAIEGAQRGAGEPGRDQLAFIINPLANVVMFAGLLVAAISQRQRSPYHKRLMLLTMLPILTTPLARISRMLDLPTSAPVGGMMMSNLFLVALIAYDLKTRGKLHPATLWGGAILLLSQILRVLIGPTDTWRSFAAMLVG
jgi:hypothetical protein